MTIVKKPFKSFKGDGKFVYACYLLDDKDTVFPILLKLNERRYRVRYDECNQEEVKVDALRKHNIKNCDVFLAFMSEKALLSPYVMNQLEMAQSFNANVFLVYLDGQNSVEKAHYIFGEDVKGIRLDETDDETLMNVMDQLLKDCQQPERIEERTFTYEELLDEVYPDQVNANKESYVNNTDQENDKIKRAAASATKASAIAKTQKRQKNGRSFLNAVLVVGAMALIAFIIYLFFGDQLNEVLNPNEVVNTIPSLGRLADVLGLLG